jgi:PTS system mannose-specific IID component
MVARLEQEGRAEESVRARDSMMGPLGALGDGFFWAKVRPAAVLLTVMVSFLWSWAAAAVLLLLFNVVHLPERWSYIRKGYQKAEKSLEGVLAIDRRSVSRRAEQLITAACGFILGAAAFRTTTPGTAMALFCFAFYLYRRKVRTPAILGCLIAAGMLLGLLGVRMRIPWSV